MKVREVGMLKKDPEAIKQQIEKLEQLREFAQCNRFLLRFDAFSVFSCFLSSVSLSACLQNGRWENEGSDEDYFFSDSARLSTVRQVLYVKVFLPLGHSRDPSC